MIPGILPALPRSDQGRPAPFVECGRAPCSETATAAKAGARGAVNAIDWPVSGGPDESRFGRASAPETDGIPGALARRAEMQRGVRHKVARP